MTPIFLNLAPLAASVLIAAIWQGTLLTLAVALCLRLLPRLSAAARSLIWMGTFIAALLLHLTPLFSTHPAAPQTRVFHADPRWSLALAALWLGLSGIRAVQLLASAIHLRRIARTSTAVENLAIQALPRQAILCASNQVDRPSVAGFFAPRILIPPTLLAALTSAELEQVLLHETEHLRRRDDWTNLLQKLALVVFPLNPVLLWVERRLCLERELACDDRVLAATAARKAYARCLTGLAEHAALRRTLAPALTLALGAWQRQSELARRVYRILGQPTATLSRPRTSAAAGTLLAGIIAAASALAHAPLLVSFAPTQSTPFNAVSSPPAMNFGGARIVEARAILPDRTSRTSGRRLSHASRVNLARNGARERSAVQNQPHAVSITYRSQVVSARAGYTVSRAVAWSAADDGDGGPPGAAQRVFSSPTPVLVPVFAYAAVPTPNGWLIIQL